MQMIPGLKRSPKEDPCKSQGGHSDSRSKIREKIATARTAIQTMQEAYDKLQFESQFMVDWYERKTNQRLPPEQIVHNVLGGQAYQEYMETVKKIAAIEGKLAALKTKP